MIEKQEGAEFPAAKLKLIYSGKILQDSQPLSEYRLGESGFVVVMVSKGKPTAQSAPPPTPSQPPTDPAPSRPPADPAPSQPPADPAPSEPSGAGPHATEGTDSAASRVTPPVTDSTPVSEPEPSSAPEQEGTSSEQSMEVQEGSSGDASLTAAQSSLGGC